MKPKQEKLTDEQRISKVRNSAEYKSKTKDFVEATKRYLFNVHGRKMTNVDVKAVKYLITPL